MAASPAGGPRGLPPAPTEGRGRAGRGRRRLGLPVARLADLPRRRALSLSHAGPFSLVSGVFHSVHRSVLASGWARGPARRNAEALLRGALTSLPSRLRSQVDAARRAAQRAPEEHSGQRAHQPVHHGPVAAAPRDGAQRGAARLRPQASGPHGPAAGGRDVGSLYRVAFSTFQSIQRLGPLVTCPLAAWPSQGLDSY